MNSIGRRPLSSRRQQRAPSASTAAAFEKYLSDPITSRPGRPRPQSSGGHRYTDYLKDWAPRRPLTARQTQTRRPAQPWSPKIEAPAPERLVDVSRIPAIPVQKLLQESQKYKYRAGLSHAVANPLAGTREDPSSYQNMLAQLRLEFGEQLNRQGLQASKIRPASAMPAALPSGFQLQADMTVVEPEQNATTSDEDEQEQDGSFQMEADKVPPLPTNTGLRSPLRIGTRAFDGRGSRSSPQDDRAKNGARASQKAQKGTSFARFVKARQDKEEQDAKAAIEAAELAASLTPTAKTGVKRSAGRSGGNCELTNAVELFQRVVKLAKRFNTPMVEAKTIYDDFKELDADGNGYLDAQEFEDALRQKCSLSPEDEIPECLLRQWQDVDVDGSGSIEFEEYFEWAVQTKWQEDLLVQDPSDRENRAISRKYDIDLLEVERYRKQFAAYDSDGSGEIDKEEFTQIVFQLMKIKDPSDIPKSRLERFWREIDEDQSGAVTFEEFASWCARSGPESLSSSTVAK